MFVQCFVQGLNFEKVNKINVLLLSVQGVQAIARVTHVCVRVCAYACVRRHARTHIRTYTRVYNPAHPAQIKNLF